MLNVTRRLWHISGGKRWINSVCFTRKSSSALYKNILWESQNKSDVMWSQEYQQSFTCTKGESPSSQISTYTTAPLSPAVLSECDLSNKPLSLQSSQKITDSTVINLFSFPRTKYNTWVTTSSALPHGTQNQTLTWKFRALSMFVEWRTLFKIKLKCMHN